MLDRYRDDELNPAQCLEFENHLQECEECRSTVGLLDSIVKIIEAVDVPLRLHFAERTAKAAFSQSKTWDAVMLSLLRPARVWAAAALLFLAVSWFMKPILFVPSDAERDIEVLLSGSESEFAGELGRIQTDEELLSLLQQEGGR
jgi:anti-sigma factor RsiW